MSKRKVICVWVGNFDSEKELYHNYLKFNYNDEDNPVSQFSIDSGVGFYDEDFMESWWFKNPSIKNLMEYKDDLLDSGYFFQELINELKKQNLKDWNSISFMFGEKGEYSTNEMLFGYKGMKQKNKSIKFIFRKEYEIK